MSVQSRKAFEFVKIQLPGSKPRKKGIIEIRGPYYTSISRGCLSDLLDDWGEFVDGYKFAGGPMRLLSRDRVRQILRICHKHGVYVSTGGFVERVIVQGRGAVQQYLRECKSIGFDVVEVSSGLANIPLEDKIEIVREVQKLGMKPKPEVSLMFGAGAGTHVTGYKTDASRMRSFDDFANEIEGHFSAGAQMVMIESEGITEDLPPRRWKKDTIKKLIDRFGYEKLMFEAAEPPVFKWYLTAIGRDVNLFIDHSQIVEFTAWRAGLWGDEQIWKGKVFHFAREGGRSQTQPNLKS